MHHYISVLQKDLHIEYQIKKSGNGAYAFVIEGDVTINGTSLNKRDALGISDTDKLSIVANSDAELLLIEVPIINKQADQEIG